MIDTDRLNALEQLSYVGWRQLVEFLAGKEISLRQAADGIRQYGDVYKWMDNQAAEARQ